MLDFILHKNDFLKKEIERLSLLKEELYFAYQFYPGLRSKRQLEPYERQELNRIKPYLFYDSTETDKISRELFAIIQSIKANVENILVK